MIDNHTALQHEFVRKCLRYMGNEADLDEREQLEEDLPEYAASINHFGGYNLDAQLAALTAERDGLRALVERVNEIGPLLHAGSIADLIYGKTANTYKLTQLLKDCQEALK